MKKAKASDRLLTKVAKRHSCSVNTAREKVRRLSQVANVTEDYAAKSLLRSDSPQTTNP